MSGVLWVRAPPAPRASSSAAACSSLRSQRAARPGASRLAPADRALVAFPGASRTPCCRCPRALRDPDDVRISLAFNIRDIAICMSRVPFAFATSGGKPRGQTLRVFGFQELAPFLHVSQSLLSGNRVPNRVRVFAERLENSEDKLLPDQSASIVTY